MKLSLTVVKIYIKVLIMISIAMATYNGERFLREQIESILAQTVTDFELVICDDCSSDSTVQILQEYEKKDNRIHLICNEQNLGFKRNFEKAISLCRGDYIALSDQDDIWLDIHLEVLMNNLMDSSLVCGSVELIDAEGKHTVNHKLENRYISSKVEEQFRQLLHLNFIQGCACLFSRDLVLKLLPIPNNQKYHDNWIGLVAISEWKSIKHIDDTVLFYRRHESSFTVKNKIPAISRIKEKILWNDDVKKFLTLKNQTDIYDSVFEYLTRFVNKQFAVKDIIYFVHNYKLIYQTSSLKLFIPRFIKRFILFS